MRVAALGVLAVLLVAGCGGGDDEATADSPLLAGPPTLLFAASEGGGSWDIYVEDVASKERTNLTDTPGKGAVEADERSPVLSQDGAPDRLHEHGRPRRTTAPSRRRSSSCGATGATSGA